MIFVKFVVYIYFINYRFLLFFLPLKHFLNSLEKVRLCLYNKNSKFKFNTEHIILINGKGALPESPQLNVPLETYKVKKGSRYRFRLINAAINYCTMSVSIEGHNLTLIASDGQPIVAVKVDSLVSLSGERYDFVVEASQEPKDYWIKIRGEGVCSWLNLTQRAILRYERDDLSDQLTSNKPFTYQDSFRDGLVRFNF